MSSLDKQGEACRKLQAEFTAEDKTYNEQRKAQKDALRTALTPVWTALKSGATVNGQKGLERWAAWFNPVAKYPLRQLQRVMGEPTEKSETTSRRVPKLVEGMMVKVGGQKIVLTKAMIAALIDIKMSTPCSAGCGCEEHPVVTPTPAVPTKVQQGATRKTHLAKANSIFPKESNTYCGKSVGKYGVPKTSVVTDNPTCKTCRSKEEKDDEKDAGRRAMCICEFFEGEGPADLKCPQHGVGGRFEKKETPANAPTVTPEPVKVTKNQKKTHVERTDGRRGQDGSTEGRVTWCGKELEKRVYTPKDKQLFGSKREFYSQYPTLDRKQVVKDHPTCKICQDMIRDDRHRQGLCVEEGCDNKPEHYEHKTARKTHDRWNYRCNPCQKRYGQTDEYKELNKKLKLIKDGVSTEMSKADVKAYEDEFNARRHKEREEATDRCGHGVRNDVSDPDCLVCFPVETPTETVTVVVKDGTVFDLTE